MKTVQERHEEQRQAKLAQIRQQIKDGTLVVRQMTDEERAKLPERPANVGARSRRKSRPLLGRTNPET